MLRRKIGGLHQLYWTPYSDAAGRRPILVLATAVCSLHGEHLNINKAFCAVGQARGFAVAEAAPDASSDAFVPASVSQLRYHLIHHGLFLLLL